MRKYHGTLIHRSQDSLGKIEVVDDGHIRSLHFGNPVRQSATDLSRPEYLVLSYTRAMMGSLLFNPSPAKVLLIGVGGGSLAKFILHHCPHCTIDAVDHRELVVKLAYGYFRLPEDPRLHIHIMDGVRFVHRHAITAAGSYDLILIDAYNDTGMDDQMGEGSFLRDCRSLLSDDGLLAINLWGRDQPRYGQAHRSLQSCFGAKPLLLPSEGTTNIIALALRGTDFRRAFKIAETRAKVLEYRTGLELLRFSHTLRKQNGFLKNRVLF